MVRAWVNILEQDGIRLVWRRTGEPGAMWCVDALDPLGTGVANGQGDRRGEALEVLIWNFYGADPTLPSD